MSYEIVEIDGVVVEDDHRLPVNIQYSPHVINGPAHTGILDDGQIPVNIMRTDQHQADSHTMMIDGRDVSMDGSKLDTIESGAQVNNLTDQQAQSLTSGVNCNWHNHDDRYFTKSQLQVSGSAQVNWGNITNLPSTFPPSSHTHPNDSSIGGPYYTQTQLQTSGQAVVDWNNISNKPTLGGNNWLPPVKERFIGTSLPADGSGYEVGDRVIWYDGVGANQHIYLWNGSFWSDVDTPQLNDTVMVSNDGDSKPAQYWYNSTIWIKIADPDYADHGSLSGLLNDDHVQYLNIYRHNSIVGNPHTTTISQTITADINATFSTSQINTLTNGSDASLLHSHDSSYYTKSYIDTKYLDYYTKDQLNNGQLDNRYYTSIQLNNGQLDSRYYTISQIGNIFYTKNDLNNGQLDNRYYTIQQMNSFSGAGYVGVSSISGISATTVQAALEAINSRFGSIVITLDAAYHNSPNVTADIGPLKLDNGSSMTAPFQISNKSTAPSAGLEAGQIAVINSMLFVYDGVRGKWLSQSKIITFGKNGNNDGNVLRLTGEVSDEQSGYKMIRHGTITGVAINSTSGVVGKKIDIRINSVVVSTLTTDGSGKLVDSTLNIDFIAGDVISMKVQAANGSLQNTTAVLEFCYRT